MPRAISESGHDELSAPLLSRPERSVSPKAYKKMGIDEMLQIHCGEFGIWQLRHFLLTTLAWALEAFHTMVMIFADRQPDWRCKAAGSGCSPELGMCGMDPGSWEWVGGAGSSTMSEWGLVCDERYKVGLVQALFFAGCMVGAGVFGHLSDSFLGRKGSLMVVCILNAIFGCLTAFSPSYEIYALLRFLTGFSSGGVGLCAFVLATEPIGPTKRGAAGMSTFYFFSGGIAVLSGIAYVSRTWRTLYIASSIPSILFVLVIIPFLSESPRWYLVRGKIDDAMKLMRKIAQRNGKNLPSEILLALDDENNENDLEINNKEEGAAVAKSGEAVAGSLMVVCKSPLTRTRLFLTVVINFCCAVVYYGLSLNVVNLGTNLYLSVLLNAVAEMPAFLLTALFLDKFGRKPLTVATMWFSGVFCLIGSLIKLEGASVVARTVCGVLGIFGMAGTYNLLFIYTVELFPTVVRNAALGCTTQAAQMGALLAPLVVVLGGGIPFAVFGACGVIGGMMGFYLPETLNQPLYDTMAGIEDGENAQKGT